MYAIYAGIRKLETRREKKKKIKYSYKDIEDHMNIKVPKAIKSMVASSPIVPLLETPSEHARYTKLSLVSIAFSASTELFFPQLRLLNLGLFFYITLPCIKSVEKSLRQDKKIGVSALFLFADSMTLATSQYTAAALGILFVHCSNFLITKAKDNSSQTLIKNFTEQSGNIWVLRDGIEIEIPSETVEQKDIIIVNAGEVIPVDGKIVEGSGGIDERILTGEAQPVEKMLHDDVYASTLLTSGKLLLQVTKSGTDTTVAKINHLLEHSVDFKSTLQLKGEQWSDAAILPTLLASLFVIPTFGISSAIIFLKSHVGNRVRLFSPLTTLNYINYAVNQKILVKDGRALEELAGVDTVLFDKTGTLTDPCPEVCRIVPLADYAEMEILRYAAIAEQKCNHPIGEAILSKARTLNIPLTAFDHSEYHLGNGVSVRLRQQCINVGSERFIQAQGIDIPKQLKNNLADIQGQGNSFVLVSIEQQVIGIIEIQAKLQENVCSVIQQLRNYGVEHIGVVSGDHRLPTHKVAQEIDADEYFYEVLPEDKASIVKKLQEKGRKVCFIGDGINDGIALKTANVSISMQGAAHVATDTASIIFLDGNLSHLHELFNLAKKLEIQLKNSFMVAIVPGIINLSGAFIFHFSIMTAILVNAIFLIIGLRNAGVDKKRAAFLT